LELDFVPIGKPIDQETVLNFEDSENGQEILIGKALIILKNLGTYIFLFIP
jgi:hypothetical protein